MNLFCKNKLHIYIFSWNVIGIYFEQYYIKKMKHTTKKKLYQNVELGKDKSVQRVCLTMMLVLAQVGLEGFDLYKEFL